VDLSLDESAAVDDQSLDRRLDVVDLDDPAGGEGDRSLVGELTAGLRIERGTREDQLDIGRCMDLVHERTVHEDGLDGGRDRVLGVTDEGHGLAALGEQLVVQRGVGVAALLGGGIGPRPLTLFLHGRTEGGLVHGQAHLLGHLESEVDREPVGVVQAERVLPRQGPGPRLLRIGDHLVEDHGARGEGTAERLLLRVDDLADAGEVLVQDRVRLLHRVLRDRQQLRHGRGLETEQAHRAHGPADEPAQDVPAALVAGQDTIGHEHEGATDVVSDHAQADVVLRIGPVGATGEFLGALDDREDLVDLVEVVLALQQVGEPLDTQAGVDRLLSEFPDQGVVLARALAAQELVEHQVPDLDVAVLGRSAAGPLGHASAWGLGTELGSAVVVPLPRRPRRSRLAGVPAALLPGQQDDPVAREADHLGQMLEGLLVLLPQGDPEPLGVQPVPALVLGGGQ
jgi:hypothetical protein